MTLVAPLAFTWPYALLFWGVVLWAYGPEFRVIRRADRSGTSTDAKSLQIILMGMSLSSLGAFPLAWVRALQFHALRLPLFFLGLAVLASGSLLRRHCWRMLGDSFTGDVRVREGQAIVTRGAYSILRHPSYTAGILLNVGVGIALGSWGSALLLTLSSLGVYIYRMTVEERALLAALGEPYREFMRTRKRIIPFVY